jgi:spermidine synthase
VLLPWVGLPGAMVAAGILNFVVAALAWWLARDPEPAGAQNDNSQLASEHRLLHSPLLRLVLFGTAISGAASFVYELVWIRMLSMAVGSTMHAFELMLASFIAGIALGGLWVRKHADRVESPLRLVGWMQVWMGVAALASLGVYANAFGWVGSLISALAKTDGGYALFNLGTASIAIAVMLPAAFFAGTTLPLFTVSLLRAGQSERAIGRVYAWNTLGSIVGVFAAIHLLIPFFGLKLALCVAALIDMGVGLILLRTQSPARTARRNFALAMLVASGALIAGLRVPFDPMQLASGVFRSGQTTLDANENILFYRDGKTASVSVVANPDARTFRIATNGKVDASILMDPKGLPPLDESTMALAAALPLSMSDTPDRVGVIGFGSGLTTHTLLGDLRVKHVDTIEIEEAMVQGARLFGSRVSRAYEDPRSQIVIDDAKAFFAGQKLKYDIIISEPSNPWISGVGALFSQEFYRFVPRHLNPGGLFVQWIQLYEIDEYQVASILDALMPNVTDAGAWLSNGSDLLIVASFDGPLPKVELDKLFQVGPLKRELSSIGLDNSEQLAFRKLADARLLRALGRLYAKLPVNSDYHPVLGLEAPRTRFKHEDADGILRMPFQAPQLLEMLGIRAPLPSTTSPPNIQHFAADLVTRRARALAADLRGEDSEPFMAGLQSTKALVPATLLRAAVPTCERSWTDAEIYVLASRMREVADLTLTFLPPDLSKGVWIEPAWMPCKKLPSDFVRAFDLLEAMAQRDERRMESIGRDWVLHEAKNPVIQEEFAPLALSALSLSLAQQNRWEDIIALEKTTTGINSTGAFLQQRLILNAMALQALKTPKGN